MGYTHYWYTPENLDKAKWNKFKDEVSELISETKCLRFESDSTDSPTVSSQAIRFNGIGRNGHETLYIPRWNDPESLYTQVNEKGLIFNFCKTAYKPYDHYVVGVLILLEKHFGSQVEIRSDGEWETVKSSWYKARHELRNDKYDLGNDEWVTSERLLNAQK
tara:strand:+ start:217 stop:702 length:486 start_codon:yes stop_codon:yes gene_type:complete